MLSAFLFNLYIAALGSLITFQFSYNNKDEFLIDVVLIILACNSLRTTIIQINNQISMFHASSFNIEMFN